MTPSLCDLSRPILVPVNALTYKLYPYYNLFAGAVNWDWSCISLPSRCPPQALQAYLQGRTPERGRTKKHP